MIRYGCFYYIAIPDCLISTPTLLTLFIGLQVEVTGDLPLEDPQPHLMEPLPLHMGLQPLHMDPQPPHMGPQSLSMVPLDLLSLLLQDLHMALTQGKKKF